MTLSAPVDSVSAALHTTHVEQWRSTLALVSALIVPAVGLYLLGRHAPVQSGSTPQKMAHATISLGGCLLLVLYGVVAFTFGVCGGGEIGDAGKHRLARAYAAPVITALEQYHAAHEHYPLVLTDLTPSYLSRAQLAAPERSLLQHPFEYHADSGSYRLTVVYAGPGINHCTYRPGRSWECGGLF